MTHQGHCAGALATVSAINIAIGNGAGVAAVADQHVRRTAGVQLQVEGAGFRV